MRILLYSDYPAMFQALQDEAQRYSGLEVLQAHPNTEPLTLPDFQFMILTPLAETAEAGVTHCPTDQLALWQDKIKDLIELCSLRQAQLILVSSDLVFLPETNVSSELDSPNNDSPLATSLLKLEKKVAGHPDSIILRTAPSLSASPEGGLAQLVALCQTGETLEQVNYRGLQPLDDLARVLLGILLQIAAGAKAWGLYHYAGTKPTNLGELVKQISSYLKLETSSIESNNNNTSPTKLPSMSSQHLLDTFGVHPRAWQDKLPTLLELLNESAKTA